MKLIFATQNENKVKEIESELDGNFELLSLKSFGFWDDIPENSDTLEGNALEKARFVYQRFHQNTLSDDTGLEVESLNGEPGIYSARYAGSLKDPEANMEKLLRKLEGKENREARFRTIIALIINGEEHLFEGIVEGQITFHRSGAMGFGYDPIFRPTGYKTTFAEMSLDEKNKISHRARALRKLIRFLKSLDTK
jgi:XTP/dITP diphosphohydrolase